MPSSLQSSLLCSFQLQVTLLVCFSSRLIPNNRTNSSVFVQQQKLNSDHRVILLLSINFIVALKSQQLFYNGRQNNNENRYNTTYATEHSCSHINFSQFFTMKQLSMRAIEWHRRITFQTAANKNFKAVNRRIRKRFSIQTILRWESAIRPGGKRLIVDLKLLETRNDRRGEWNNFLINRITDNFEIYLSSESKCLCYQVSIWYQCDLLLKLTQIETNEAEAMQNSFSSV